MKKLLLFLSVVIIFGSCYRDDNTEPSPTEPVSTKDLIVNPGFDWKTTKDYNLSVTGKENNLLEVKSENGAVYLRAFLTADVEYSTKLTIPSYKKRVILNFSGKEVVLDLNSDNLSYQFQ